ncbi:DUF7768 domain-containing protein, partial [Faecalibacterium prausnitzii]|uniref:DUF7768 domain-containing protein n=1 Tax=Faecalibacterium prausnitzii TaxID=853 RepID=UPI003F1B144A
MAIVRREISSSISYTASFLGTICLEVPSPIPTAFSPICPPLYLPLFLNDAVPEEHKSGIDMSRDLLRRSHVLVVC